MNLLSKWSVCSLRTAEFLCCQTQIRCLSFTQVNLTRRSTVPASWRIPKRTGYVPQNLTPENKKFIKDYTDEIYADKSPLVEATWERGTWEEGSIRTGMIFKKIGIIPQWNQKGERFYVTLLQVADNHVINYIDPETWQRDSKVGRKRSQGKFGCVVIGADSRDPQLFTGAYRGLFENAGCMPKKKLGSFLITPNAKLPPGTKLSVTHFRVGQYVDCFGRTRGFGFQGAIKRWNFKVKPDKWIHSTTKNMRRTGTIGTQGDACVKPGKKMPGHMGMEWRCNRGLKIWRINTKYQVLYVHGNSVPGPVHHYVYVKDTSVELKKVKELPFPTDYPEERSEPLPEDIFAPELFQFSQPSISLEEVGDVPVAGVGSKVKKQAKAKK